jgi:hypothetical protein
VRAFARSIVSSASLRSRSRLSTLDSLAPATPPPPNLLPTRFCATEKREKEKKRVNTFALTECHTDGSHLVVCSRRAVSTASTHSKKERLTHSASARGRGRGRVDGGLIQDSKLRRISSSLPQQACPPPHDAGLSSPRPSVFSIAA